METTVLYLACCPVCGRALFRGKPNSDIEGYCPKCKKLLKISFTSDGVVSFVSKTKKQDEKFEI